jgi:hypothetical protein
MRRLGLTVVNSLRFCTNFARISGLVNSSEPLLVRSLKSVDKTCFSHDEIYEKKLHSQPQFKLFNIFCILYSMRNLITLTLLLVFSISISAQESKMEKAMRYSYLGDFNSVSSSQESVTGTVFDDIDIILNYTVLENVDGGRIFKDVSVYSTDVCKNCKMDVEFSEKQFHEADILDSQASIFLTFSLVKNSPDRMEAAEEVKAKLTADGKFSIRKDTKNPDSRQ